MKSLSLIMLVCGFALGGWARPASLKEQREILVTDEAGTPVVGARVDFACAPRGQLEPYSPNEQRTTDRTGRCVIPDAVGEWYKCCVRNVQCPGYVFEDYLNPTLALPMSSGDVSAKAVPFRFVIRKQGGERYVPYRSPVGQCLELGGGRQTTGKPYLDVNLLRVGSDWAVPFRRVHYTDFTVTPHIDSDWRKSYVEFSVPTSHVGCGVIATTNRVFTAPESGYSQSVRVSPEMFTSPSFTLYLRTRDPVLYVMIAPAKGCHVWTIENGRPFFRFSLASVDVNLAGTRLLEPDLPFAELGVVGLVDVYHYMKENGRYFTGQDIQKRIETLNRIRLLQGERTRLSREKTIVDRNIQEMQMRSRALDRNFSELGQFQDRNKAIDARLQEIDQEVDKLHF